jgi:hypothetical protein
MPNTFLDSYFKGRQEKLERDQLAQQAAQQQAQLAFSQQQLAQQAGQFQIQQGFDATQAAERTRLAEAQFKQQAAQSLFQNRLGLSHEVGQGNLKQAPIPLVPKAIGVQAPAQAGEIDFEGNRYAPTTIEERAAQARALKSADVAQAAQDQAKTFGELFKTYDPTGTIVDPQRRLGVMASVLTGQNMSGLFSERIPNNAEEFYGAIVWPDVQKGQRITMAGNPVEGRKYTDKALKDYDTYITKHYASLPTPARINNDDDARIRSEQSETEGLLAAYYSGLAMNPNAENFEANWAEAINRVRRQLGGRFNAEIANDYRTTIKRKAKIVESPDPAQSLNFDIAEKTIKERGW